MMKKGIKLFSSLFSLVLLCSCQNNIEDPKNEGLIVLDTVENTVNEQAFLSATVEDEKARVLNLEITDTEKPATIKKEINTQLKNQGIQSYTINVTERSNDIVKKERRWRKVTDSIFDNVFTKNEYKNLGIQQMEFDSNQPYILGIHTKISNSDPGAKEFGNKIKKEIDDLLKTDEISKWIENDSYTIEIYSKDKQKINL